MTIPYGRQKIDKNDVRAVIDALQSDWITQGPKVQEFEKSLANYSKTKYAVAVSSGTAALHLAYLAAELKPGNEVITTPNTFAATSNMLMSIGVKPVFCDIRLDTYNIDENKIEKYINKKTKAIAPVHFAGQVCEMDKILKLAKKHKLFVIEDASHALGSKYKDKKIGSFGDMTILSFHAVKAIATGEGGAILTNNKDLYKKLTLLRSHGIYKDENGVNVMDLLGYNYRLTDIQSALGISQLKKLDRFIEKRRQIVSWYKNGLKDLKDIILPTEAPENYSAWHIYVIRTKDSRTRNSLKEYLKNNGIGVNFHYPAVYSHPYYRKNGYGKIKLINEEVYHDSAITLPLFPTLSKKEVKYICNKIKNFYL